MDCYGLLDNDNSRKHWDVMDCYGLLDNDNT